MPKLVDKQKQIPNGNPYYCPELNYRARQWDSLHQAAVGLQQARLGNPEITRINGWSTEIQDCENTVEEFLAIHCQKMGWNSYVSPDGGQAVPFYKTQAAQSQVSQSLRNVAAGARVLVEWIDSGEEAVPIQTAEERAEICSTCPKNTKGDWTYFFTEPVANEIRRQLERKHGWNLRTSRDSELGMCSACQCPLPLKMWVPLERVKKEISEGAKAKLDPRCWILK